MLNNIDLFGSTYYLQRDKIDDTYGKVVGEVVGKIIRKEQVALGKYVESKFSLGNLLTYLGLNAGIGVGLNNENVTSREVITELPYENKLIIALNAMEKEGKCCDFNESLKQHKNPTKHIYFKGDAIFSLRKENPEQFLVRGNVEDYTFESFCSKKCIISESLRDFLNEEGTLPIFCAGYIMRRREKSLDLTLYYIGGP